MGKGLVTEIQDQYKDAIKQGTANGLKREMTDEAKQANVQTANKQMTDALRGVAQQGTGYRLGILGMVNNLKANANKYKSDAEKDYAAFNINEARNKTESALNLGDNFLKVGSGMMGGGLTQKSIGGDGDVGTGNSNVRGMNDWQLSDKDRQSFGSVASDGWNTEDMRRAIRNAYNNEDKLQWGMPYKPSKTWGKTY